MQRYPAINPLVDYERQISGSLLCAVIFSFRPTLEYLFK